MRKRLTRSAFGRAAENITEEELRAFLLKLTRQLRDMVPPCHVVGTLNRIEAEVEQRAQRKPKLRSFDACLTDFLHA